MHVENLGSQGRRVATSAQSVADRVRETLRGVLADGVDVHRTLAARALGRIGGPGAADALLDALLDEDEDVRADAARGLARLAPEAAGDKLLESLLGDPSTEVKLAAIEALVRLRQSSVVPWLRRLVQGRDPEIAWDEDAFHEDGWDDWLDAQVAAIDGLVELGIVEAVPEIAAAIDDEFGQDLSEIGFKALARLGAPGADALAAYLGDDDVRRRRRAAAALAGIGTGAAETHIARALRDPAAEVRLAAAGPLAARAPADSRLAALFDDPRAEVRAMAVTLCGHGHARRTEALLDDASPEVRRAVLGLAARSPSLLPATQAAERARIDLAAPEPALAAAAAAALSALAPEAAAADLIAVLGDAERPLEVRLAALRTLGECGGEDACSALARVLDEDRREPRLEAMTALARLARERGDWPNPAGLTLLAALRGELVAAQEAAQEEEPEEPAGEQPSAAGPAEAFPTSTLKAILGAEGEVPDAAAVADIELSAEDLEFLALARRRPFAKKRLSPEPRVAAHEDVRRFAARLLGDLPRRGVAEALAECLDDDDGELEQAAADSLARLGAHGLPAAVIATLMARLSTVGRDARLSLVRALGACGGMAVRGPLIECLGDEDSFVRAEAARALAGCEEALPPIEALLDDPDPGVRLAAAGAVAASGARALDKLVAFAFAREGRHRREAGRLLRELDAGAAAERFVAVLDDAERLRQWPVAIEALEELMGEPPEERRGERR